MVVISWQSNTALVSFKYLSNSAHRATIHVDNDKPLQRRLAANIGFGECIRDARVYTISYHVHIYKITLYTKYGGSNKIHCYKIINNYISQ